jgi:hypothetical protein
MIKHRAGIYINCLQCDKKIYVIPAKIKEKKFCSRKCKHEYQKTLIGGKNHRWKGGRIVRGGYVFISKSNYYRSDKDGYVAEHIYKIEKKINRQLGQKEEIHHIDGNPLNNKLNNLLVCAHKEHRRLHSGWIKKNNKWFKKCTFCKQSKEVNKENFYVYNRKKEYREYYSSHCKECSSKKALKWLNSKTKTNSPTKLRYIKQQKNVKNNDQ